jgi:hypothetical protein
VIRLICIIIINVILYYSISRNRLVAAAVDYAGPLKAVKEKNIANIIILVRYIV